jgi:LysR family transcriptional regulator, glycine cleavage system transcriptional activator
VPLISDLLRDGSLVAPFAQRASTNRAYWLVRAASAQRRPQVDQFAEWLMEAVRQQQTRSTPPRKPRRRAGPRRTPGR